MLSGYIAGDSGSSDKQLSRPGPIKHEMPGYQLQHAYIRRRDLVGISFAPAAATFQLQPACSAGAAFQQGNQATLPVRRRLSKRPDSTQNSFRTSPTAVFRNWRGAWTVRREVDSRRAAEQSGSFAGMATFQPTAAAPHAEYLYREAGIFCTSCGSLRASRSYVYAFDEGSGPIDSFFVGQAGDRGSFFHTLHSLPLPDAAADVNDDAQGCTTQRATGQHPCRGDIYRASYTFELHGSCMA